ncbi:hypothetical protein SDC9_161412 [bioreactor metagenome]|uniref:Uncharacterized protein n=1 Tax=bioreactor metagenome TaxID=1076179 RepID=A0A645FK98_9ZZZZ
MLLKVAAVQSIKNYKRDSQQSKEGSTRKKPNTFAGILKAALKK